MNPRRPAALALAACLPACLLVACASDARQGYAFGTGFPADVKSVSVPIFRNASTSPGIEADVTEAIIKELQRAGGMTITSAQGADTTLTGVITDVRMKRLSVRSGTGLIQELAYQITVNFDWKDERTGKVLTSRRDFVATDTFVPATGVGERIDTGRLAATSRLARDLVNELRGGW
ncbi:MAG: LPS assembly lipoprotein LptE [Phycisphaerae bacterium]